MISEKTKLLLSRTDTASSSMSTSTSDYQYPRYNRTTSNNNIIVGSMNDNNNATTTAATTARTTSNGSSKELDGSNCNVTIQQQNNYWTVTSIFFLMMLIMIYTFPIISTGTGTASSSTHNKKQHSFVVNTGGGNGKRTKYDISTTGTTKTPVFGVLTQPIPRQYINSTNNVNDDNQQYYYIAASYIKWLEAGGIRSIPIPYDANQSYIDELFYQINGILLPGGGSEMPFAVQYLFEKAIYSNLIDKIYFPIWGTCLGFEFIIQYFGTHDIQQLVPKQQQQQQQQQSLLSSRRDDIRNGTIDNTITNNNKKKAENTDDVTIDDSILESGYLTENISLPLDNVIPVQLYNDPILLKIVSNYNVTLNNHEQGISPTRFQQNLFLPKLFQITSTNIDDKTGKAFVSTIEPNWSTSSLSLALPIYGVQYHPEKNTFEYSTYPGTDIPYEAIDHTANGIQFSLQLAQFVGQQLGTRAVQEQGMKHSYNQQERFPIVSTYPVQSGIHFEQIYILPGASG